MNETSLSLSPIWLIQSWLNALMFLFQTKTINNWLHIHMYYLYSFRVMSINKYISLSFLYSSMYKTMYLFIQCILSTFNFYASRSTGVLLSSNITSRALIYNYVCIYAYLPMIICWINYKWAVAKWIDKYVYI